MQYLYETPAQRRCVTLCIFIEMRDYIGSSSYCSLRSNKMLYDESESSIIYMNKKGTTIAQNSIVTDANIQKTATGIKSREFLIIEDSSFDKEWRQVCSRLPVTHPSIFNPLRIISLSLEDSLVWKMNFQFEIN